MNLTLNVSLKQDRTKLGYATMVDADGTVLLDTVPVLAKADNATAAAHGNPDRDPQKPYGDTPTGLWTATVIPPGGDEHAYGPIRRLLLAPKSGPCTTAKRESIECHGGDLNMAYLQWKYLRPTHGCLRFTNSDIATITQLASTCGGETLVNVEES